MYAKEKTSPNPSLEATKVFESNNQDLNSQVSSFSLSSIEIKKAAKSINKPKKKEVNQPNDDFELSTLESIWKEYTEKLKKEGKKNIASILGVNSIILKDYYKISYTVPSEMNKVEIISEMENLLPFIRKKLNNYSIKIEVLVSKTTKKELVYSATEKYQYLKKINPLIEDLRKMFDLDF